MPQRYTKILIKKTLQPEKYLWPAPSLQSRSSVPLEKRNGAGGKPVLNVFPSGEKPIRPDETALNVFPSSEKPVWPDRNAIRSRSQQRHPSDGPCITH